MGRETQPWTGDSAADRRADDESEVARHPRRRRASHGGSGRLRCSQGPPPTARRRPTNPRRATMPPKTSIAPTDASPPRLDPPGLRRGPSGAKRSAGPCSGLRPGRFGPVLGLVVLLAAAAPEPPPARPVAPSVDERRPSARELRAARQDLDELRADMRSRDAGDRKRAVRKAAQIGGPDALAFVLDALGDERGQVADTAESMLVEHFAESAPEALQGAAGLGSDRKSVV